MMLTEREVFSKVKKVLVDCLGVDEDEVKEGATLVNDLGAGSLDLSEISFRCETEFGVRLDREKVFPNLEAQLSVYVKDGFVNDAGLEFLKQVLSYADFSALAKNRKINPGVLDLFTVGYLVRFIANQVNRKDPI